MVRHGRIGRTGIRDTVGGTAVFCLEEPVENSCSRLRGATGEGRAVRFLVQIAVFVSSCPRSVVRFAGSRAK
jgi:hypothetical protein